MKLLFASLALTLSTMAFSQNEKCADIFADTGRFASPKNFYTQKSSNEGISWVKRFNERTKQESYILILRAYNPEFYPAIQKGLIISLKNEKTIAYPDLQATGVKCTNQRGCVYEVSLNLNEEELKLLLETEIVSYKIGSYTTKTEDGKKHQEQLLCLTEKKFR